jgi:hypothetical protein
MFLLAVATVPSAGADVSKQERPIRAVLSLVDDGQVVGVPDVTVAPLRTAYARIDLPLEHLVSAEFGSERNVGIFRLRNGDKLKGRLELEAIEMQTLYGTVSVPLKVVDRIEMVGGEPDPDGLVLYHTFDNPERLGEDRSKAENHGAATNVTFSAGGRVGGAAHFSGSGSGINLGSAESLMKTSGLTLAAWVKMDKPQGMMLTRDEPAAGRGGWVFYVSADYELLVSLWPSTSAVTVRSGSIRLKKGRWHHVACTWDGSKVRLYLDGKSVGTPVALASIKQVGAAVHMGKRTHDSGSYRFAGLMDEVMIYNRGLSDTEIRHAYGVGR